MNAAICLSSGNLRDYFYLKRRGLSSNWGYLCVFIENGGQRGSAVQLWDVRLILTSHSDTLVPAECGFRVLSRAATCWSDKNNFHINYLMLLNTIYPDAQLLHIVRAGRDVACSNREIMQRGSSSPYPHKHHTDISSIATEWSTDVLKMDDYLPNLTVSSFVKLAGNALRRFDYMAEH